MGLQFDKKIAKAARNLVPLASGGGWLGLKGTRNARWWPRH
jgi:hypothetical protein